VKLRPYQEEARSAILRTWGTNRSHICVVATGGGKNMIAAGTTQSLLKNGGAKVLFLANRNELISQPIATFRDQTGIVPAIEKAESKASLNSELVIASVQTLSRAARLERFPLNHFTHIWADEAHLSAADSWKRIFQRFPAARIAGLTATPFRSDNKSLSDIFETESFRADLFSLVDRGWLVDPDHVDKLSTAISLAEVRVRKTVTGYDYDPNDAADAIEPWFEEIAKEIRDRHSARRILAFLPLIVSSQKFVAACLKVGLHAVHIDGDDPEREEKIAAFRDGKITLLSNSNLLHTGLDFPSCDTTLCLRPTRSKVLYAQIVGRSTRALPGVLDGLESDEERLAAIAASPKPKAYILDPLWMSVEHDLCTPAFLIARDQADAEAINRRAGASYSLRAVNAQVVAERESEVRRRFQAAAQFRAKTVSADFFASAIHKDNLLDFDPVYPWEKRPLIPMDRNILVSAGIDPATVTCQGHCAAIKREVYKRRSAGRAEISLIASVARRCQVAPETDLWSLSTGEARAMLAGQWAGTQNKPRQSHT
jgi:superfamily II DNA or RNA helicase